MLRKSFSLILMGTFIFTLNVAASTASNDPQDKPSPGSVLETPSHAAEAPKLPWPQKDIKFRDNGILNITVGSEHAPVTIHEISSVTCYHCAGFHKKVLPDLKKKYIDTGLVRLILHHCPIDGVSMRAAMVLSQVPQATRYIAIEAMLDNQPTWFPEDFSPKNLRKFAENLEKFCRLPSEKILEYMSDDKLAEAVIQDRFALDKSIQIDGTPTFIINGEVLLIAATFENIEKLIQSHLKDRPLLAINGVTDGEEGETDDDGRD